MNDRSDKKHVAPQESGTSQIDGIELSPRQSEIYQNLTAIGPEIAAYYLDGIRILQNEDLQTAASLLGHIAREIDGGLRDVLSEKRNEELEFIVRTPDGNELTYQRARVDTFKFTCDTPGTLKVTYNQIDRHKPSILQSLGIDTPSPLAERWFKTTKKFYRFDHRRGAWKPPRAREEFVPLWCEFEDVLADLVGNYLNLLSKVVDRILAYEEPTDKIRGVLLNLLKSEARRKYFFERLDSSAWLGPLKEDGWFTPESNISVRHGTISVVDYKGHDWWRPLLDAVWFAPESNSLTKVRERSTKTNTIDRVSPWYALEYVKRIADHAKKHPCDTVVNTLVEIVDVIVDCAEDTREKFIKDSTLSSQIIGIISALPENKTKEEHRIFSNIILKFKENEMIKLAPIGLPETFYIAEDWIKEVNSVIETFSGMSNAQIVVFLEGFKEEEIGNKESLIEQKLAGLLKACVAKTPQRFVDDLRLFQDICTFYQHSILSGLLTAWENKKEFDWAALLEFVRQMLLSESFWTEPDENNFVGKNRILSATVDLINAGTEDDNRSFDPHLLPFVEQILLVLVEKVESSRIDEVDLSSARIDQTDPSSAFLNSFKGSVFQSMMNYALYFARTNNIQQKDFLWPQAIRDDFTKRLDKRIESSFEFSFALGMFLPELFYLDQEWVISNIDRIFPQHDEHHWYVAFSGYLFTSQEIHKSLYFLLKEGGHYQKALNTNFAHHTVETALATHICTFRLENDENLNDKISLIYQVLNSNNLNFLSAVLSFFSAQINNLTEAGKAEVRSVLRILFEVLSENKDEKVCREIFGELSKWVVFIDRIDEEALEWLKVSVRYVTWDIRVLIKTLLEHASETPEEVGIIYIELAKRGIGEMLGSLLEKNEVIKTVRILYDAGYKNAANQICVQFAEAGFSFLKPLYNEYQS